MRGHEVSLDRTKYHLGHEKGHGNCPVKMYGLYGVLITKSLPQDLVSIVYIKDSATDVKPHTVTASPRVGLGAMATLFLFPWLPTEPSFMMAIYTTPQFAPVKSLFLHLS